MGFLKWLGIRVWLGIGLGGLLCKDFGGNILVVLRFENIVFLGVCSLGAN